jgi:hypothetical protein
MNAAGATRMTLSGTVINCNAAAVTNGFVDIMVEGTQHKATVTNGSFNYTFNRCSSAPFTAVFQAYDLDKNQTGPATNITIASRTANAGQVSACGNTVNEFFNYTLDGTPVSYVLPADTFAWYSGTPPYPDVFEARRKANTKLYDDVWIRYEPTGVGTIIPQTFSIITPNSKTFVQRHNSKLNINITEFGAPGGYVGGNFSDSLIDSFTKKIVLPINGVFRVKRK